MGGGSAGGSRYSGEHRAGGLSEHTREPHRRLGGPHDRRIDHQLLMLHGDHLRFGISTCRGMGYEQVPLGALKRHIHHLRCLCAGGRPADPEQRVRSVCSHHQHHSARTENLQLHHSECGVWWKLLEPGHLRWLCRDFRKPGPCIYLEQHHLRRVSRSSSCGRLLYSLSLLQYVLRVHGHRPKGRMDHRRRGDCKEQSRIRLHRQLVVLGRGELAH